MRDALLVLDLETTGLDCRSCGIVELAAVLVQDGAPADEWSSLCWPGYDAVKSPGHWTVLRSVSGISPAALLDAPDVGVALARLSAWLTERLGGDAPVRVTSYNVAFDRPFIEAAPWYPMWWRWEPCLMLRAQRALGLSRWPKLAAACEAFGIAREGEHRALDDARAAAALYLALEGRP